MSPTNLRAALALGLALTVCAHAEQARVVGVGVVIKIQKRYPVVESLVPGSPAAREGTLKPGDRIEGVAQGEDAWVETAGLELSQVVDKIRGRRGSTVRLRVMRLDLDGNGARQQVIVTLKRDVFKDPSIKKK